MCLTFGFRWPQRYICTSSYDFHWIGNINPSHLCYISPRLCVSVVFVASYSVSCFLLIPGKLDLCFLTIGLSMICANNKIHYNPNVVSTYLRITSQHHAELLECDGYITCWSAVFCRVYVEVNLLLSSSFYARYRTGWYQLTAFPLDDLREYLYFMWLLLSSNRKCESLFVV